MNIVFILSALIASTVAEPVDSTLASSQILNLLNTESRPQSMMIPFEEIRIHRIRKEPLRFAGIMRINPALGISVAYSEPEETTFILTSGGLRIRQEGKPDQTAPEEAGKLVQVFLDLLTLNASILSEQFTLEETMEPSGWTLTLVPSDPALLRHFESIRIQGEHDWLKFITIEHGKGRRKQMVFRSMPLEWDATPEEIKSFF